MSAHDIARPVGGRMLDPLMKVLLTLFGISSLFMAYRFYADRELGTTVFTDLASPAAPRHGAYGLMIVEPRGSTWTDSQTGVPLSASRTSTRAIISPPLRPR